MTFFGKIGSKVFIGDRSELGIMNSESFIFLGHTFFFPLLSQYTFLTVNRPKYGSYRFLTQFTDDPCLGLFTLIDRIECHYTLTVNTLTYIRSALSELHHVRRGVPSMAQLKFVMNNNADNISCDLHFTHTCDISDMKSLNNLKRVCSKAHRYG